MSFEDVMMKRLADCHAEACNEILASVKAGRSLSDAVTDAIEALPASKTRDLRRWLQDWEAWEEWQGLRKDGWRIKRVGNFVYVQAPHGSAAAALKHLHDPKYGAIVAAAVGVRHATRYDDSVLKVDRGASAWRITTPNRYIVRYLISTDF